MYLPMMILFALLTPLNAVDIKNDRDAILTLGMEMSNIRDMLKGYVMVGAGIQYKNPAKRLQESMDHYESLLQTLEEKYLYDTKIKESIAMSRQAWKNVKEPMLLALQDSTHKQMKEGGIFIHGNIRTVIRELAKMKKYFIERSTIQNKEALNASIEIAASVNRLSAHYMMALWNLDDPTIEEHWNKGLKIYGDSVEVLKHSVYVNNPQFRSHLEQCIKLHKYFTKMWNKPKLYSARINDKAKIAFDNARKMTEIILK